jgi:hypothetical protein
MFVLNAFEQLKLARRRQPFSNHSLDELLGILNSKSTPALQRVKSRRTLQGVPIYAARAPSSRVMDLLDALFANLGTADLPSVGPYNLETVIKDLKALGVRSKLHPRRSG